MRQDAIENREGEGKCEDCLRGCYLKTLNIKLNKNAKKWFYLTRDPNFTYYSIELNSVENFVQTVEVDQSLNWA